MLGKQSWVWWGISGAETWIKLDLRCILCLDRLRKKNSKSGVSVAFDIWQGEVLTETGFGVCSPGGYEPVDAREDSRR